MTRMPAQQRWTCDRGQKWLVDYKSELLRHQPVWILRASQASLVNKCWVDLETICGLACFPFQILPPLLPTSLIFMPLVSNAVAFSKYFFFLDIHTTSTFFSFCHSSLSPCSITRHSTVTYAWSMSDEVQEFLFPCCALTYISALNLCHVALSLQEKKLPKVDCSFLSACSG